MLELGYNLKASLYSSQNGGGLCLQRGRSWAAPFTSGRGKEYLEILFLVYINIKVLPYPHSILGRNSVRNSLISSIKNVGKIQGKRGQTWNLLYV